MTLDFSQPYTERTPRVVAAAKLHRSAARKKARRFLAEGFNSVEAALNAGQATDLFVTEHAATQYATLVSMAASTGVHLHAITEKAAAKLGDTVSTTGIIALCSPVVQSIDSLGAYRPARLVGVGVSTSEPGNAGTLIRAADALGADHMVFAGDTVDPQGLKAVRSSAGSLFHIPVIRERSVDSVLTVLREQGLQLAATSARGTVDITSAGEKLAGPTAWLFGNEAHGLSDDLLSHADLHVRIPLRGRAESLNLATAAAICMYESARAQYAAGTA